MTRAIDLARPAPHKPRAEAALSRRKTFPGSAQRPSIEGRRAKVRICVLDRASGGFFARQRVWSFHRETDLPTQQDRTQAPTWFSRPDGDGRWSRGAERPPRPRAQEALGLTGRPAASAAALNIPLAIATPRMEPESLRGDERPVSAGGRPGRLSGARNSSAFRADGARPRRHSRCSPAGGTGRKPRPTARASASP